MELVLRLATARDVAYVVGVHDVLDLDALAQARLIREGLLTSTELTRAYLDRIARLDGRVTSFVEVDEEGALRAARRKDLAWSPRGRESLPPFFGVPTALKDLHLFRGLGARFGSRAFRGFRAFVDDALSKRIRAAGFVVLGKTTTSELGTMPVVEPDIHPPTRNPWDLERTAGGSSGGAGAAVAAHLLPIAPSSDGAGSTRIPASFNHLFGIKPSRGRVPNQFGLPDRHLIYTSGPIARSVADAAALLDVLAGLTVGAPHWAPPPPRPFQQMIRERPRALRVRVVTRTPLTATAPAIEEAVLRVARTLQSLGHHVDEGTYPADADPEEFYPVWQHAAAHAPVPDWALVQPLTRWLAERGRGLSAQAVEAGVASLERRILAWTEGADVVLTPTVAVPPPRVFAFRDLPPEAILAGILPIGAFTAPFNASGQPAASIPVGLDPDGLPIGAQIVGGAHADALVLQVAAQIEEALPFRARTAPLARSA